MSVDFVMTNDAISDDVNNIAVTITVTVSISANMATAAHAVLTAAS